MATNARAKRSRGLRSVEEGGSNDYDPPILCVGCGLGLSKDTYAQLVDDRGTTATTGCQHTLCMECFSRAHGDRSADIKLCCQRKDCSYSTIKWNTCTLTGRSRDHRWVEQHSITPPKDYDQRYQHPNLYFKYQDETYQINSPPSPLSPKVQPIQN